MSQDGTLFSCPLFFLSWSTGYGLDELMGARIVVGRRFGRDQVWPGLETWDVGISFEETAAGRPSRNKGVAGSLGCHKSI